jgi:hypothetical protein
MKEPKRMLAADATGLERLLLQAVAGERPSADQRLRMRAALGLPVFGLAAAGIKAAVAAWGPAALIAVVAAVAAGGASSREPERMADQASAGIAVVRPAEPVPAKAPVAALPDLEASEAAASEPAKAVALPKRPSSVASDLREEIRLLDQARAALRESAPARALERIGQYSRRFPHGQFRQEATVLRIEALAQNGERASAEAMARRFLAAHPESPHAQRVAGSVASSRP